MSRWGDVWEFSPLDTAAPSLVTATTPISAAVTVIGVPNVVLNHTDTTNAAAPVAATGVVTSLLRLATTKRATAIGIPTAAVGFGIESVATAPAVAVGVPFVTMLVSQPSTSFDEWLNDVTLLLDDILDRQATIVELSSDTKNIVASVEGIPRIVEELYTLKGMALSNNRRIEMARTLSTGVGSLESASTNLSNLTDLLADDTAGITSDVEKIRVLLEDIPGLEETTPPASVTTLLTIAAVATPVAGVTTHEIPRPPTAYAETATAVAIGIVDMVKNFLPVAAPQEYEIGGPAQAIGTPNATPLYIPYPPLPITTSISFGASARGVPNVTPTHSPATPPTITDWYGCPYTGTSLGELEVGVNTGNRESYLPWRAPRTGNVVSVRFYLLSTDPGYAEGTGGNCRIRLVQSTGSGINTRPTETQVGTGQYTFTGMANHPGAGDFPKVAFSAPIPVVVDTLYYVQHHNTHSVPENNWYSADIWSANWNKNASGVCVGPLFRPYSPFLPDEDLQCFYKSDTSSTYTQHPCRTQNICELEYSDGTFAGYPYGETWHSANAGSFNQQQARLVTAAQWHRQRFTNTPAMTLTHVSIAAKASSGTADLILEVRNSSMTVQRTVNFPSSSFPATATGWLFATPRSLGTPISFAAGSTFYVTVRTTGSTVYNSSAQECGQLAGRGFHQDFAGFCEYSTNQGSTWSGGWPSKVGVIRPVAKKSICFVRSA